MKLKLVQKKDENSVNKFKSLEWGKFNRERGYAWKQKKYLIIAELNKKILGYVEFKIVGGTSYLGEFIVSKKSRREGIGNLLIKKFEDFSKKKKCHVVWLETTEKSKEAIKFYKKHGYKIVGKLKDNKFHFTCYFFEKRLK